MITMPPSQAMIDFQRVMHAIRQEAADFASLFDQGEPSTGAQGSLQWRTIGGEEGDDGKKHGGTHVLMNIESGAIEKGPKALTGKTVDQIKQSAQKAQQKQAAPGVPGEGQKKPKFNISNHKNHPLLDQKTGRPLIQEQDRKPALPSDPQSELREPQRVASPNAVNLTPGQQQPESDIAKARQFYGQMPPGYDKDRRIDPRSLPEHKPLMEASDKPEQPADDGQMAQMEEMVPNLERPWEMSSEDYLRAKQQQAKVMGEPDLGASLLAEQHEQEVAQAANRGEDIPEHVLNEYPHIAGDAMTEQHRREKMEEMDRAKAEQEERENRPPVPLPVPLPAPLQLEIEQSGQEVGQDETPAPGPPGAISPETGQSGQSAGQTPSASGQASSPSPAQKQPPENGNAVSAGRNTGQSSNSPPPSDPFSTAVRSTARIAAKHNTTVPYSYQQLIGAGVDPDTARKVQRQSDPKVKVNAPSPAQSPAGTPPVQKTAQSKPAKPAAAPSDPANQVAAPVSSPQSQPASPVAGGEVGQTLDKTPDKTPESRNSRFPDVPRMTAEQFANGEWDGMEAGLFDKEETAANVANGMKGVEGKEYGIMSRPSGKWQIVSKSKHAQENPGWAKGSGQTENAPVSPGSGDAVTPPAAAEAEKPQEPKPDPVAEQRKKRADEYNANGSFKQGIDRALHAPNEAGASIKLHKLLKANADNIHRSLGTSPEDQDNLFVYRSPNRPLNFIGAEAEDGVKAHVIPGEGYLNDTMVTAKPLSPERIAGLELTTVPYTNSQKALAGEMTQSLFGKGNLPQFTKPPEDDKDKPRGKVIFPSPSERGKYQLSHFDDRGFYGHENYNSQEEAAHEAIKEGFHIDTGNPLDNMSRQDSWKAGAKSARLHDFVQHLMDKAHKPEGRPAWNAFVKVRGEQGDDAALEWMDRYKKGGLAAAEAGPKQDEPAKPTAAEVQPAQADPETGAEDRQAPAVAGGPKGSTPPPAEAPEHAKLPPAVRERLTDHLSDIRELSTQLAHSRENNRSVTGPTAGTLGPDGPAQQQIAAKLEEAKGKLNDFRERAKANGIDGEKILKELSPPEPSAEQHDEIYKQIDDIDKKLKGDDLDYHAKQQLRDQRIQLEGELRHHKPAAWEREAKQIKEQKAKEGKAAEAVPKTPTPSPQPAPTRRPALTDEQEKQWRDLHGQHHEHEYVHVPRAKAALDKARKNLEQIAGNKKQQQDAADFMRREADRKGTSDEAEQLRAQARVHERAANGMTDQVNEAYDAVGQAQKAHVDAMQARDDIAAKKNELKPGSQWNDIGRNPLSFVTMSPKQRAEHARQLQRTVREREQNQKRDQKEQEKAQKAEAKEKAKAEKMANRQATAASKPAKDPAKQIFGRDAIQKRLADAWKAQGGDNGEEDDKALADYHSPFTFLRTDKTKSGYPREVEQFLERPDHIKFRKMFSLSDDPAKAQGADAMGVMGEDKYFNLADRRTNGTNRAAIDAAHKSNDPEHRFLAALHDNANPDTGATRAQLNKVRKNAEKLESKGDPESRKKAETQRKLAEKIEAGMALDAQAKNRKQDVAKPEDLKEGDHFTIHGIPIDVIEGEDGLELKDHGDIPTTPVESLSAIPVDQGSKGHKSENDLADLDDPFADVMDEPSEEELKGERHEPESVRDAMMAEGIEPSQADQTIKKLQENPHAATQGPIKESSAQEPGSTQETRPLAPAGSGDRAPAGGAAQEEISHANNDAGTASPVERNGSSMEPGAEVQSPEPWHGLETGSGTGALVAKTREAADALPAIRSEIDRRVSRDPKNVDWRVAQQNVMDELKENPKGELASRVRKSVADEAARIQAIKDEDAMTEAGTHPEQIRQRDRDLENMTKIVADSPGQIRPADIDRLMSTAHHAGNAKEMAEFLNRHADVLPRAKKYASEWTPEEELPERPKEDITKSPEYQRGLADAKAKEDAAKQDPEYLKGLQGEGNQPAENFTPPKETFHPPVESQEPLHPAWTNGNEPGTSSWEAQNNVHRQADNLWKQFSRPDAPPAVNSYLRARSGSDKIQAMRDIGKQLGMKDLSAVELALQQLKENGPRKVAPPNPLKKPAADLGPKFARVRALRQQGMSFEEAKAHQQKEADAGRELPTPIRKTGKLVTPAAKPAAPADPIAHAEELSNHILNQPLPDANEAAAADHPRKMASSSKFGERMPDDELSKIERLHGNKPGPLGHAIKAMLAHQRSLPPMPDTLPPAHDGGAGNPPAPPQSPSAADSPEGPYQPSDALPIPANLNSPEFDEIARAIDQGHEGWREKLHAATGLNDAQRRFLSNRPPGNAVGMHNLGEEDDHPLERPLNRPPRANWRGGRNFSSDLIALDRSLDKLLSVSMAFVD